MKILALDYDGVLVNSSEETFVTSYNVYLRLTKPEEFERGHFSAEK